MLRAAYQRELQRLQDELILLSSMVAHTLRQSMTALRRRDRSLAESLIERDREINARRYQIEHDSLVLIATQQPVARDLRFLAGVIEIAGELERIGDYAKGIGRIVLRLPPGEPDFSIHEIPRMCDKVLVMLERAQQAYLAQDIVAARAIPADDDVVDALYNAMNARLLDWMRVSPIAVEEANLLLWAAHNIERAGDRVTNICERTIYTVTGDLIELDMQQPTPQP